MKMDTCPLVHLHQCLVLQIRKKGCPYPAGITKSIASEEIRVHSTPAKSTWTIEAGLYVRVVTTGEGSTLDVTAIKKNVYVENTGVQSTLIVYTAASHDVWVKTTGKDSTLKVKTEYSILIQSTGNGSTSTLEAAFDVTVESTGIDATLNVIAGEEVSVESTGEGSTVIGYYGGSMEVIQAGIGEDATVDLKPVEDMPDDPFGDQESSDSKSIGSTITIRMISTCILLILLLV